MKELSIEEKAERYDNIIEKANKMHHENCEACQMCIEELIPELSESEDEKIRKHLITLFTEDYGKNSSARFAGIKVKDILAWLEKKGEQNVNRETKPRTYGDFIKRLTESEQEYLQGYVNKVIEKTKELQKQGELKFKVGDWIIFNGLTLYVNEVVQGYYRTISIDGIPISYDWDIDNVARLWTIQDAKDGDVLAAHECYVIFKEIDGLNIKCYCTYHYLGFNPIFYKDTLQNKDAFRPATKEQRDALMKAISDAGYTFDFEKKELKKIEQKTVEWSEEDKYKISRLTSYLKRLGNDVYVEWLESLKERYTWKPSDEQMRALNVAANYIVPAEICAKRKVLRELLEQLKKLRGE